MLQLRGDLQENHLLGALPLIEWQPLAAHLELVWLQRGQVLAEPGQRLTQVYFPTTAIVSLLYTMENGASVEIAAVGGEGLFGVPALTGGETMPSRAQVHHAGFAYRISTARLRERFGSSESLRQQILLYMQALLTQIAQTAACNRHHSLAKQLCRWLLLSIDRLASNQLSVTQETIANLLGVRREGITEAIGKLHDEGLIDHSRGRITVLDRHGLEVKTCECYGIVRKEFDRLLPRTSQSRELVS